MELHGKVAFITGAAAGIGKGFAEKLLQMGAKVFIGDIDESEGEATLSEFQQKFGSHNVRFMKLDVSDESQFEEVFKTAVVAFGQVDIIINNAGIMNESKWQQMIKVNLLGVVKGSTLAEEHMRKDKGGKGGRIINVCSVAGLSDVCFTPIYGATKHAVRSFTIAQADQLDLEAQGIQYAVLCPQYVSTNMTQSVSAKKIKFFSFLQTHASPEAMPVTQVADALLDLLQLPQMNGAILCVTKKSKTYLKMEQTVLGSTYKSAVKDKNKKTTFE